MSMTEAKCREHIFELIECMAKGTIEHLHKEMDDDSYLEAEDMKTLHHAVCALGDVADMRKDYFELEDMTEERIRAWTECACGEKKSVPMTTVFSAHHGGNIPTNVPVPPAATK